MKHYFPVVWKFGLLAAALLVLFQLGKYSIFVQDATIEVVISLIAILFLALGYYLSRQFRKPPPPQPVAVAAAPVHHVDEARIRDLGLSKREYEVLTHLAVGLSNQEIADKLFVSESTIKTHVSNVLQKLDVKRRTQAVAVAREMGIVA
ncbi:MAG: response regulator transcription factor [Bacteroidota bacterium]